MRTEELLALGVFGSGSRLGERIAVLLARGGGLSARVSKTRVAWSAAALVGLAAAGAFAPRMIALAQDPAFEVASIRPASFPGDGFFAGFSSYGTCTNAQPRISGSRVTFPRVTLCSLIMAAYDVRDYRVTGAPAWMLKAEQSNYYEIEARAAGDAAPTVDQARAMLRTLLADRFHLKLHRDTKEMAVYALVIAKSGSKLSTQPVCDGKSDVAKLPYAGIGETVCQPNSTVGQIARGLSREVDRPVVDETGLTGQYAYSLHWMPEETGPRCSPTQEGCSHPTVINDPAMFTAVQEQLGLKLEPRREPIEVLVIDHAEKPDAN